MALAAALVLTVSPSAAQADDTVGETSVCPAAMVVIPGGGFVPEGLQQRAAVPRFCLDRTEVTVRAYTACVKADACTVPFNDVEVPNISADDKKLWSRSCNIGRRRQRGQHPVNCVNWEQAEAYCRWRGARLPSEEEWTWAARGGDEARRYPWGDGAVDARRANVCGAECKRRLERLGMHWRLMHYGDDDWPTTAPVGSFPLGAGRWGVEDLAGNVWEFTASPFADDPRTRVIRGGGWAQTDARWLKTTVRAGYQATSRGSAVGFRCAADTALADTTKTDTTTNE